MVDPFAGGGSIPLEALRLGCEAFASDLTPVACLILKVMLEDIPRHGPGLGEELRRVEIERLAQDEVAVPEFLELLEDRASYDLAWDLEDAIIARARCYEDRSEFHKATAVLQDLFYRLASPEREAGLNELESQVLGNRTRDERA